MRRCAKPAAAEPARRGSGHLRGDGEMQDNSCLRCILIAEQIIAYCMSALAGGTMFYRWRIMDEEDRRRMWPLYGWYSGLMTCGSCVGIATWWLWMQRLIYTFKYHVAPPSTAERLSLRALGQRSRAAFSVTYAIEFLCLSVALLMVLDRMASFVTQRTGGPYLLRWTIAGRIVMGVVVVGNVIGLVCSTIGAVYWQRSSDHQSEAAIYFAGNNTQEGARSAAQGVELLRRAAKFTSLQAVFEAVVLQLILLAFVGTGIESSRRIRSALVGNRASVQATGQKVWLQVMGTTVFIFVTFLLRSVFSTMQAASYAGQGFRIDENRCALQSLCDDECYNMYSHILYWMTYKPEFQLTIVLISSPLSLLVALWGMTPDITLGIMQQYECCLKSRKHRNQLGENLVP